MWEGLEMKHVLGRTGFLGQGDLERSFCRRRCRRRRRHSSRDRCLDECFDQPLSRRCVVVVEDRLLAGKLLGNLL